jgi:RNA polymerase sigma-70 factor (ECF subfamily)
MQRMLDARKRRFDILLVWRYDRFAPRAGRDEVAHFRSPQCGLTGTHPLVFDAALAVAGQASSNRHLGGLLAPSREALLHACASGDRAALQSLYAATAPQLFCLALSILRSHELAEDIVQDSFILVWRHAHSFDPRRGTAMAWLARIVRNQCFDLMRRRGRESPLDHTLMESWEDPAPNPADLTALSRDARRLWGCLDELDEGPRKSMILAYYDGLTFAEVAGRTGAPLGTVKSWIRRGLIQLRDCMER